MASFFVVAFVIGLMFSVLFSQHNINVHHAELERRATSIANTLAEFIGDNVDQGMDFGAGRGMGGFGGFLRYIESIAMSYVWIVDSNAEQIIFGQQHRHSSGITYRDFPEGSDYIIANALGGSVAFCESFSLFWGRPTVTVAAPIILSYGSLLD